MLPEAQLTGVDRAPYGNTVYGSYGTDFATADGERVMVVALTARQWASLLDVTGTTRVVAAVETELNADFSTEGDRWTHREVLTALLRPWFAARTVAEVAEALAGTHVLWSPFRRLSDVAAELAGTTDPSAVVSIRSDSGVGPALATTGAIRLRGVAVSEPAAAPTLGEDTAAVFHALRSHERPGS
jgi:2-methylfumaryl-CoA isomerase